MKQNNRATILSALGLAILAVLAGVTLLKRQSAIPSQSANAKQTIPMSTPETAAGSPIAHDIQETPTASDELSSSPQVSAAEPESKIKPAPQGKKNPGGGGKKVIQDPIAREALALAGADPYAEEYWFAALDNPALSQSERQDLVDDLNEEGLPDPKHPTVDDLPLLLARVELLEEAAQRYGDQYEFQEPYDDLAQLIRVALGSREIVH